MSWRTQGLYLHRTRKPHAIVGLPLRVLLVAAVPLSFMLWFAGAHYWWLCFLLPLFSGRHNAYVGQTSSRYFRDQQHKHGSFRWQKGSAAWADLDIKIYPLPCLFPRSTTAREIQEKLWILLLLPVYNTQWNSKNPRRITSGKAEQQRYARMNGGVRKYAPRVLRFGIYAVVLVGAIYSGWERWF
jgi:hypothetical protein